MLLSENLTDKNLVESFLNGNNKSFELLLSRHKSKVFAFIMSKIKNYDVSEDIFQDTFIKAITSLKKGQYNEQGKFLPWVMRIAHNLVIDYFRKSKRISIIGNPKSDDDFNIFDVIGDGENTSEYTMMEKEQHQQLNKIIDSLPEQQKEVLIMRHYEDLSFKEIAEKTGVSINTSLGRMRYALINLRKIMLEKKIDLMIE